MKQIIYFDYETDGLNALEPIFVGVGYKVNDGPSKFTQDIEEIRPYLEDKECIKVAHNMQFELAISKTYGINVQGPLEDTQLLAWVLNMGVESKGNDGSDIFTYGLKDLEQLWFGRERETFKQLAKRFSVKAPTGKVKKNGEMGMRKRAAMASEIPVRELGAYCIQDVEGTYELRQLMMPKLTEQASKIYQLQLDMVRVYEDMIRNGVKMDVPYLLEYTKQLDSQLEEMSRRLGSNINYSSPAQLAEYLYEIMKLPVLDTTPKGVPSTGKWALKKLSKKFPEHKQIFKDIKEYRRIRKYRDTYVRKWIESSKSLDGRVHFSINPIGTISGRISSDAQQIPKRTPNAGEVRRAIVAKPGNVLCELDYSQVEPRIMAHLSQDPKLLDVFKSGKDIYRYVAGAALKIKPEDIAKEQRDLGKILVLAINYGETEWGLADNLEVTVQEARQFLKNYFEEFPHVKIYQREQILRAKQCGYVDTIYGTRRTVKSTIGLPQNMVKGRRGYYDTNKFKREEAERQALNIPIQGTAADVIKIAMSKIHPRLHPDIRLLLQVHDALLFELPEFRVKTVIPRLRQIMEQALPLSVPTPVNVSVGKNLFEMEEI